MGFKLDNFGTEVANAKGILGGICYYRYRNEEGDDLTRPGYFPALLGLNVGDRIFVIPQDASNADDLYVVTSIANRTVEVEKVSSGGGGSPTGLYREFELDADGVLQPSTTTTTIMDFTGITDVSDYALAYAYNQNTAISGAVDMSDLTAITGKYGCFHAFDGCTGLTSADLSSLTTVSATAACEGLFNGCTGLTSANLSSLTTVSGNLACSTMFQGTAITSIDLSALTTVGNNGCGNMFENCTLLTTADISAVTSVGNNGFANMFSGCSALTTANLSSLATVGSYGCQNMFYNCVGLISVTLSALSSIPNNGACGSMFAGCTSLTTLSFPALTTTSFGSRKNQFDGMCSGIPNITLHFPSNIQTQVEALTGYSATAPFGAVSGSVLFDLPATE